VFEECLPEQIRDARIIEHVIDGGYDPAWLLKKRNVEAELALNKLKMFEWLKRRATYSNWLLNYSWKVEDDGTSSTGEWWAAPLPRGHSKHLVTIEEALRRQAFRIIAMHLREVGYCVKYEVRQGLVIGFGKCFIPGTYRKSKHGILYRGAPITMTMAAIREGFL
jgi:ribosomal protein S16